MFLLEKLDPSYRDTAKIEVNIDDKLSELADAIQGKGEEPEVEPVPEKPSTE
jgi:hypothetical protein